MRRFTDTSGGTWDVAVGKESYGNLVLLFSAAGSDGVRKTLIAAETRWRAEGELARMTEGDLRRALTSSIPWENPLSGLGAPS